MRVVLSAMVAASAMAATATTADHTEAAVKRINKLNADNPHATFSINAVSDQHTGGGYTAPSPFDLKAAAAKAPFTFTGEELRAARKDKVSIDWRKHGAVNPIQQQHPFGTCWAFSAIAVTEAVMVIQGKKPLQKLSEQMMVSCVPEKACGDNADVQWSWFLHITGGSYQTDEVYPYNRTCNFYREQQHAPDGTNDGYPGKCNQPGHPSDAPCPPCPGVERKDGTPACKLSPSSVFSEASVQGWGFISPHGVEEISGKIRGGVEESSGKIRGEQPQDVTRMVAALLKYGPAQIGIASSCVEGYTGGIISNCTNRNVDHAVAIVGADTDPVSGIDYWIVRNSWNTTFGEDGYFRVQRDTNQMGIFGGYFACYNENCKVDP